MNCTEIIFGFTAAILAGLVAFTTTPIVRTLAYKIGAVDIPKDNRRMHDHPIPRLGGLAIFIAFVTAVLMFCEFSPMLLVMCVGGLIIVVMGVLDDIFRLHAVIKLLVQIAAAVFAVVMGVKIEFINFFGEYISFGIFSIPITILWIVGLTNAINIIDGLDGLSCGVSAICSLSLLLVTLTMGADASIPLVAGILAGACIGFLPFNSNPAKIFMGDTGALFLGYVFSILSIQGLFKVHTIVSFIIPISIFGFPLFDTVFAFFRRLCKGKSPFSADNGHIHHRLIAMGFNQKQSVYILYAVCGILGISAVMFTEENMVRAGGIVLAAFAIFAVNYMIIKNPDTRKLAGFEIAKDKTEEAEPEKKVEE